MNTARHYELTDETIEFDGHMLHRIRCTKDFLDVKKGTLGGFIEDYENLQEEAWVSDNAKVYGRAIIMGHAWVGETAIVRNEARVLDTACVSGNACVSGYAHIFERAIIMESATVTATDYDTGICNMCIYGDTKIAGRVLIANKGSLYINHAVITGDAIINYNSDYIVFKNWWSSGRYFTWTRSNDMWHVGHFYGTGKELIAKAYKDSKVSGREYERVVKYVEEIKKNNKPSLWQRVKKMLTGK